ncbi:MAG: metal-dependent hydrolase [Methylococcaceae bacterium]|nr:metal-dependent hydrolase [Methylococcaceae bacterium]
MTPPQHFIISWVVANSATLDRRSRVGITLSGLLPDVDGLGYVVDKVNLQFNIHSTYYIDYHHYLGHNLFAGLIIASVICSLCQHKTLVFLLSLFAFHLHLLADIAGSKGGDGYQWPIYYLYPLMPDLAITWQGQWLLSSWINSAIGVSFFIIAIIIARYRHITFFEFFSTKVEKAVAKVAWQRRFFKD